MKRRLWAEALGSFFLFATVVGSGIMAEKLAGGNVAVALLATAGLVFVYCMCEGSAYTRAFVLGLAAATAGSKRREQDTGVRRVLSQPTTSSIFQYGRSLQDPRRRHGGRARPHPR